MRAYAETQEHLPPTWLGRSGANVPQLEPIVTPGSRREELREFLKAARQRVKPEMHGFLRGSRRRTPGLRREEVADLIGVSAAWYTLFERARERRVSMHMLDRISKALLLSDEEKLHLYSLAIPEMPVVPKHSVESGLFEGTDLTRLRRYVKMARSASSPLELKQVTVEFVRSFTKLCDIVAFVEAELQQKCFNLDVWISPGTDRPPPMGPQPMSSVPDSDQVLIRGEVFGEHDLESSANSVMHERAKVFGTGRYLSAGIITPEFHGAIVCSQFSREPYTEQEREQLGLVADLVALAISGRD
jgi:transcriptional regulator with XRE-family HTH domain